MRRTIKNSRKSPHPVDNFTIFWQNTRPASPCYFKPQDEDFAVEVLMAGKYRVDGISISFVLIFGVMA